MSRLAVCLVCDAPKGWRKSPVPSWCEACGQATPTRQLGLDHEPIRAGSSITFGQQRRMLGVESRRMPRKPRKRGPLPVQLTL